ncbi:MCE family protein [Mycolicibacterium thermoresistibile]|uniref:Virulence factor Mce family protein n=2 Tax=Mycolicibacterium thermoresistibile TaxID=1797 RepID=G7CFX1_MYCT3|nr:MCE family protein [Mycolicibacterium thermoresistibile]EHI13400.1 virulence factor Mce family protein [Mycolicibacterium thermoresistibile ATCC 19527]MCV7189192.1 MCE family protein [Mycolicibacterium thermoresistibile]GAT14618.1 virulence factor Mce family protein [Mycolicibacterium thermoresistibile]SNW19845.1 virulence factor Mce family protein [Mycolicibacterium thermoresistibile]
MTVEEPGRRNPLRTGIFGITLVVLLMLVSFGYTGLPFMPQGRVYTAFFTNAAGITSGSDVQVYGYNVGAVKSVDLDMSARAAKVTFTVDRKIRIGDQTMVAIKTDTVLGQRILAVTPGGVGSETVIPLGRTTTPYTLSEALQDLGHSATELDTDAFQTALQTLTDTMRDATPRLRGALDGIAALSRSVNARDEKLEQLLHHTSSLSQILARRARQLNQLISDGNALFAELSRQRAALAELIAGIGDVSRQVSGFVADNRREFGPMLVRLNLVLDNLLERRAHIDEALKRVPSFSTTLGEVVGSGPGFSVNIWGVPNPEVAGVLLDTYFQPGKLPDSLADMLRGFIRERLVIRPKTP